ncbi:MAG TPA: SDR family oxidoreductase [Bryobacteraceae bacterium]|nr:SDR family oxidoreductase [Bryobacteraceae bacterium]
MDFGLAGKSALVLAASKGLGRACALALAREGASVTINSRESDLLEKTAAEIRAETGMRVHCEPGDVTDPDRVRVIFDGAVRTFGRVDILVNNAGGPPFGPFEQFDDEQWHRALELNLMSAVRFTRLALPAMKEARWGRIVNIVSLGTKSVLPGSVLSTAGRLGIIGMAKLLSDEVAALGITVNNVASGIILTDRVRQTSLKQRLDRGMDEKAALEDLAQTIPAKRVGEPAELAALVAFLASERAGYITGTTVPVDGGIVRSLS